MNEFEQRFTDEVGRVVAENGPHGRTDVRNGPVLVDDGDDVGDVLDERLKALLCSTLVGNVPEHQHGPSVLSSRTAETVTSTVVPSLVIVNSWMVPASSRRLSGRTSVTDCPTIFVAEQ